METTIEEQQEDIAFEASFAEARGEPPVEPAAEVVVEPTAEVVVEPTAEVVVEPQRLIAGLTEEQLQAVLARNSTLQGTVDKMAGRLGQLMQQVETIRNTPATPATQHALDLKLERLSGSFPELANLLREDLASASLPATPAEPAVPAIVGITQEQLDSRLAQVSETTNEAIEVKVLGIMHPDWLAVIQTPQFSLWRDTVLPAGEGDKLMASGDANEISTGLTGFKDWLKQTTTPVAPARAGNRLANAVMPNGGAATAPVVELSEEAAFNASFNAEQRRRGV